MDDSESCGYPIMKNCFSVNTGHWLMQQFNKDHTMGWRSYISDDTADEGVFRFVRGIGADILVTKTPQDTQAMY